MKRMIAILMLVGMSLLSGAVFADGNNSNASGPAALGCMPGQTC